MKTNEEGAITRDGKTLANYVFDCATIERLLATEAIVHDSRIIGRASSVHTKPAQVQQLARRNINVRRCGFPFLARRHQPQSRRTLAEVIADNGLGKAPGTNHLISLHLLGSRMCGSPPECRAK